jgi:hypothetical protein
MAVDQRLFSLSPKAYLEFIDKKAPPNLAISCTIFGGDLS